MVDRSSNDAGDFRTARPAGGDLRQGGPEFESEQVARRSMLARYHAMLAKAALRREALKVNPEQANLRRPER